MAWDWARVQQSSTVFAINYNKEQKMTASTTYKSNTQSIFMINIIINK